MASALNNVLLTSELLINGLLVGELLTCEPPVRATLPGYSWESPLERSLRLG